MIVAGVGNGEHVVLECMDPSNGAVVGRLLEKPIPHDWKGLWRHAENVVVPTDWNPGPGVRYLALRLQVGALEKSVTILTEAPYARIPPARAAQILAVARERLYGFASSTSHSRIPPDHAGLSSASMRSAWVSTGAKVTRLKRSGSAA